MPFKETCRMEERVGMLAEYDSGPWSVSELCRRHGVSRATFYAWRARRASGRASGDANWFSDRSHATQSCPHRTGAAQEARIVALRRRFPHLGPRKLLAVLATWEAATDWPAASMIGDILKRAGLVEPARRRRRPLDQPRRAIAAEAANDEGAADFKGWFRTRDQRRIDPLTITDSHTRFLIETRITAQTVDARLCDLRPAASDPLRQRRAVWLARGAGGLTRLSAWWLRLGVEPHFIRPASPRENGRHERMHRTLKKQTSQPPAADAREQQARFDQFRRHYNEERPHEALGQRPPADLYAPSPRDMPERLEDPWCDADHQVRRVGTRGEIKWRGAFTFISEAVVGELVGLAELENGDHVVRFCGRDLGLLDRHDVFRHNKNCRPSARSRLSRISPVEQDIGEIVADPFSRRTARPPSLFLPRKGGGGATGDSPVSSRAKGATRVCPASCGVGKDLMALEPAKGDCFERYAEQVR